MSNSNGPNHAPTAGAGYVVGLLWIVNIFNYIDRMALPVLMPTIKSEMGLSDSQIGILVGLAFAIFYAVCGIPIARLADRTVRKNLIAAALAIWSVMTIMTGMAQNYWQLFLARMGVGAGEAGCIAPSQSIICDLVTPERRAGALAFHMTGTAVGSMFSMMLAGVLSEAIGWRWTLVALGLPGLLIALVVMLTIKEPRRGQLDAPALASPPSLDTKAALRSLATNRIYVIIVVWYTLNGFMNYGLSQWWPSFFVRSHAMTIGTLGFSLGVAIGIGTVCGTLLGGVVANRLATRSQGLPLRVASLATLSSFPTMVAALFVPNPYLAILAIGVANFLMALSAGPALAAIFNVTSPITRATAGALPILFTAIFGFSLGPMFVGMLSDGLATGYGSEALRVALILPTLAIPLMALALWRIGVRMSSLARESLAR